MALSPTHPFYPPGYEFLGEPAPRSRTVRAKLIELLEADRNEEDA